MQLALIGIRQMAHRGRAIRLDFEPGIREVGAALDRELDVDQPARMIHVRLRHQQSEILAFQRSKDLGQSLGQRRRNSLERLVKQQTSCADAERAAKRDQLLLATTQEQRLAMAHLGEFADYRVYKIEPGLAVEMLSDP